MRQTERALIRDLFLRFLGVIFLIAFLSLYVQVLVLIGSRGLLPAQAFLAAVGPEHVLAVPAVFWISCSDGVLRGAALLGAALSVGLICGVAPRYCLLALWALYLSFVTVGQDFFSFQWDNLLLESAFFSLFITPGGVRSQPPQSPHPVAVFLMLWLVFRLHVESGAAKLLTGDPTWRDLTAMASYYETAPLPTWVGWYAHQLPLWVHKLASLFTLVAELGLALLIWGPHRLRGVVFILLEAMQVMIVLTANYGFFNYLSMLLCLWILDDEHLRWLARRCGVRLPATPQVRPRRTLPLAMVAALLVGLSIVPFLRFTPWRGRVPAIERALDEYRSINAYHLFASMTVVRPEAVIEGSDDGEHWQEYELCYKPGDPARPPSFVAPHQPRVDFQMWFLLLGPRPGAVYFDTLLKHLLDDPQGVAALLCRQPFPEHPPRFLRVATYRYRFTDWATRQSTGRWWDRQLMGYSAVLGSPRPL